MAPKILSTLGLLVFKRTIKKSSTKQIARKRLWLMMRRLVSCILCSRHNNSHRFHNRVLMMMTMTPSKRKLLVEALLRLIRSDDGSQYLCYETAQNFLLILAWFGRWRRRRWRLHSWWIMAWSEYCGKYWCLFFFVSGCLMNSLKLLTKIYCSNSQVEILMALNYGCMTFDYTMV